jgi:hypothetical protein
MPNMLNTEVLSVLSQLNAVTNSIIIKHPQTVAVSEAQDVMICVDVSELGADPFEPIPLKDSLSDFLNLFKLFPDDRSVEVSGNTINISAGDLSSSYIMDNAALMDAYNKDPAQFKKTQEAPSVATFDLLVDDMKNIKSATGVFKDLSEVLVTSQDGDIMVSLGATNKFNAKSNKFSVRKEADTSKEFEIKIPVENFKMLPVSDYVVDVKYNSARDAYRILLTNKSFDSLQILMSVKV